MIAIILKIIIILWIFNKGQDFVLYCKLKTQRIINRITVVKKYIDNKKYNFRIPLQDELWRFFSIEKYSS